MIVERHYDDETLIGLLGTRPDAALRDPHLSTCPSCADAVGSYRAIAQVLGDATVWNFENPRTAPPSESLAFLRAASRQLAERDAQAAAVINELMAKPAAVWRDAAHNDTRYRTTAVVHRLVELSEKLIDSDPPQALITAHLATEIADTLSPVDSLSDGVAKARAASWRQYAYALFYTGELPQALEAADRAEDALASASMPDYDLARIQIVRSVIYSVQNRYEEAVAAAREAGRVFRAFGDGKRLASSLNAQAYALIHASRYREALAILIEVDQNYRAFLASVERADVTSNIALCYANTGRIVDALEKYQLAAAAYEAIGAASQATRLRFSVAVLMAAEGQHQVAKQRLRAVHEEFLLLGMHVSAVSANLVLAEVLLAENAYDEVVDLCATCIEHYHRSGMSVDGLTALSYLQEAAAHREATPEVVRHVRRYFDRLPHEPALLFAPPPSPPE
jgi:tetratricopeptide (TPR) repeat protein